MPLTIRNRRLDQTQGRRRWQQGVSALAAAAAAVVATDSFLRSRELSLITSQASTRALRAEDPGGDLIELQIRLHRTDSHLLRAIEEALARIERGTYCVCESCKRPIAKVRLEAVLWARHCRHCKESEHA